MYSMMREKLADFYRRIIERLLLGLPRRLNYGIKALSKSHLTRTSDDNVIVDDLNFFYFLFYRP